MPLNKYIVLKKAVNIEAIVSRRTNIQDVNRAFHDPVPLMKQLEKEMLTLLHGKNNRSNTVSWGKDKDWKSQLSKFQI